MNKSDFRIIFMGTPDFAVASLKELNENNFNIVAVVTAPDKPAGRGQNLKESAVKEYAKVNNLNILQPENLKSEAFRTEIENLRPDLMVVVAFRMLPESIWSIPKNGTINLHASLLPQYRGAAPINWAIINGEKETGVTTFFIEKEIDTGKIIYQDKVDITPDMKAEELHDLLMNTGSKLLSKTVDAIINKSYKKIGQESLIDDETDLKIAPKIFKENCRIDWHADIGDVYNFIRGLSPYPTAWTELHREDICYSLKIYEAEMIEGEHNSINGAILTDNRSYIYITTNGGLISLNEIQLQGKKRMNVIDFLNGFSIEGYKLK